MAIAAETRLTVETRTRNLLCPPHELAASRSPPPMSTSPAMTPFPAPSTSSSTTTAPPSSASATCSYTATDASPSSKARTSAPIPRSAGTRFIMSAGPCYGASPPRSTRVASTPSPPSRIAKNARELDEGAHGTDRRNIVELGRRVPQDRWCASSAHRSGRFPRDQLRGDTVFGVPTGVRMGHAIEQRLGGEEARAGAPQLVTELHLRAVRRNCPVCQRGTLHIIGWS